MKLLCPRQGTLLACGRCLRLKAQCVTTLSHQAGILPKNCATAANAESVALPTYSWLPNTLSTSNNSGAMDGRDSMLPTSQSSALEENFLDFFQLDYQRPRMEDVKFYELTYAGHPMEGMYESSTGSVDTSDMFVGLESSNVNLEHRIFRLRTTLSIHSTRNTSTSRDPDQELYTSPNGNGDTSQPGCTGPQRFEEALRSISKFVSILGDYDSEVRSANAPSASMAISVVMILDILLAYLQLVAVYDVLCSQLLTGLQQGSRSTFSELQMIPRLQIAGFSVESGHLKVKVLIQAITHHFETIERVFGLPVGYRISDRAQEYIGLFTGERSRNLMEVVMEDYRARKALASLRESLRSIERIINI